MVSFLGILLFYIIINQSVCSGLISADNNSYQYYDRSESLRVIEWPEGLKFNTDTDSLSSFITASGLANQAVILRNIPLSYKARQHWVEDYLRSVIYPY